MLRDEARLESAQRRHPHEYEGVERHHPPPQLVGHEGLQHGVGERGGDDHRAAGKRLERERHADGAHGREQHQEQPERRAARQQDHTLTDPRPLDGESQGPEHRPDAHRCHQQAVATRVGVQYVASDHRHQHDEREPQHAEYCHQGHQRPHPGIAPDERHGLTDALPGRGWHRARHERREPHGEEAGDHGDVAHAVQEEAHADAGDPNQHSRNRRADDPGGVEHGRVERDRVHEILFADELHDERLAGGNVERIDDAEEHRQHHDLPRRDPAGPHEHGQRERFEHLQSLRPHDEATLVHAIHDDTRVQREQQHAQGAERLRQPDGERRVGDAEHQPAERDRLHPGPDERDALTEEEQPEVAVGKRSEPKRARGGGGGFVHCGKARRRPIFRVGSPMKYTTYSRYLPELADTVNLQALLDQLADFLLQSGFAGGAYSHPFWGEFGEEESDRSLDALRQAILQALMDSGQLTPEMLKLLRGESTGDAARDADLERQLGELLDKIVQKPIDEGYLNVTEAPKVPSGQQPLFGPGGMAKEAAQQVQFNLTEKGIDFLGYRTLKHLLGSIGKSSFGAHETEHLATGVEAEAVSKQYEYGDTLNLDVNATLTNALQREGFGLMHHEVVVLEADRHAQALALQRVRERGVHVEVERVAVLVLLTHRFGLHTGREVLRFMGSEARLADAPEQVLQGPVAEEVDALFGEVELHLLGGFFGHSPRAEQGLLPRRHLGRLADVQVPLVDQLLDDLVEQLGELALEIGVAGRVAGGLAAQQLEHLGRQLPRVHERLENRLPQRVERAVGLVLAELPPERMRVCASGEARLQQKIGELIEQGLEIQSVGQLGQVARVRRVFHWR